jgi:hypothetical protein
MTNSPKSGVSNFGPSSFINDQMREMPCFLTTRAGFSLLAMGSRIEVERRIEAQRARRQAAGSRGGLV